MSARWCDGETKPLLDAPRLPMTALLVAYVAVVGPVLASVLL